MPTETFFHLPEDKKERIISAALIEFAKYSYPSVVLDKIVQDAEIPKGSLYQYFRDKKDLYSYLVEYAAREKLAYLAPLLKPEEDSLYDVLEVLFYSSMEYNLSHPRTSGILYRNARERSDPVLSDISAGLLGQANDMMRQVLARAQERGKLRDGLDIETAALLIIHLSIEFEDYLGDKYNFSYRDVLDRELYSLPVPPEDLKNETRQFIRFILAGLEQKTT
ncbi:MAG: TetR/AcrR family transcriptional regulator [Spirochaetia bacterium]